jgi:hypothetical protein
LGDKRSWKRGNLKETRWGLGKVAASWKGALADMGSSKRERERERERERVVELYAPHKTNGVQVVGWMVNLLVSFVLVVKSLLNI